MNSEALANLDDDSILIIGVSNGWIDQPLEYPTQQQMEDERKNVLNKILEQQKRWRALNETGTSMLPTTLSQKTPLSNSPTSPTLILTGVSFEEKIALLEEAACDGIRVREGKSRLNIDEKYKDPIAKVIKELDIPYSSLADGSYIETIRDENDEFIKIASFAKDQKGIRLISQMGQLVTWLQQMSSLAKKQIKEEQKLKVKPEQVFQPKLTLQKFSTQKSKRNYFFFTIFRLKFRAELSKLSGNGKIVHKSHITKKETEPIAKEKLEEELFDEGGRKKRTSVGTKDCLDKRFKDNCNQSNSEMRLFDIEWRDGTAMEPLSSEEKPFKKVSLSGNNDEDSN